MACCLRCNNQKGNRTPEEAGMARFFEDTAVTRGLQCRVFLDVEVARQWLLSA